MAAKAKDNKDKDAPKKRKSAKPSPQPDAVHTTGAFRSIYSADEQMAVYAEVMVWRKA